ncbi:bifunctional DNA primase/polymerase [Bradyrhizobium arachidis]|uniref:phage/plasmid primase, P4 family n=1 Tax=Bradyrhizobium arachidis TaxID=858423 RepID=UPI0021637517|nr:phage/plasmid primase, P4 family [Bradyrhizobium arachidis]UVO37616.1 bifunctional DNA primase/polymerase [Bradyrhizobium arachidis]
MTGSVKRIMKKQLPNTFDLIGQFVERGLPVLPLVARQKRPAIKRGLHGATTDKNELKRYFRKNPRANYGICTGGTSNIFVLDIDGPAGRRSLAKLISEHGKLPKTVTVLTGGGEHRYFRSTGTPIKNSAGRLGEGLDIRGDRGYVVGPGSVHPSGSVYTFKKGRALDDVAVAVAPAWLLALVASDRPQADARMKLEAPTNRSRRLTAYVAAALDRELERLSRAPNHQRNHYLNRSAFKLGQLLPYGSLDEDSFTRKLSDVARRIGLEESEIMPTIRSGLSAGCQSPRRLHFIKCQIGNPAVAEFDSQTPNLTIELSKLRENDTDNAQRFAWRWADRVLYTPGKGWLVFDGRRWKPDSLLHCMELAKRTARMIADEAQHLPDDQAKAARRRFADSSLSKGSLERMIDLAKSLVMVDDSRLDANPWLLNTIAGTIDLRTGDCDDHDPRDLLTKIAPVAADRTAKCPQFRKFLKRVTGGDRALMKYIKKCAGYSLTGSTQEQVFFFCYGRSGSNGKSTLVNLMRDMLGDYSRHTPTETLLTKQYDNNIPADLARLAGVRMVSAIEANFDRHLDEAKLKSMTGGEPITARFMRQDFFEFTPAFKLWLVANDMPRVRGTDTAFWRRVRVVPFEIQIPDSEKDPELPEKLRQELPGILAWAVRGCKQWRAEGLIEPVAVRQASRRWLEAADHLKRFVADCIIVDPGSRLASSSLLNRYNNWCGKNGEQPLTIQKLNASLRDAHNFTHKQSKRGSEWVGLKIRLQ